MVLEEEEEDEEEEVEEGEVGVEGMRRGSEENHEVLSVECERVRDQECGRELVGSTALVGGRKRTCCLLSRAVTDVRGSSGV